jgi:hypothetical protein
MPLPVSRQPHNARAQDHRHGRRHPEDLVDDNLQKPACGHRIAGVDGEVQDGALKQRTVRERCGRRAWKLCFQDHRFAEGAPQEREHTLHHRRHVEGLGTQRLTAPKGEQLLGEACPLFGSLKDQGGEPAAFRLLQLLGQHFGVADHDGEQVVEVVGDAPRELAHRLHLLRLAQLLLEAAARRHVAHDAHDLLRVTTSVAYKTAVSLDPHPMPALMPHAVGARFVILGAREEPAEASQNRLGVFWMEVIAKAHARDLVLFVADEIAARGRDVEVDAARAGADDHVGGVVGEEAVARLALLDAPFRLPPRGHIREGGERRRRQPTAPCGFRAQCRSAVRAHRHDGPAAGHRT